MTDEPEYTDGVTATEEVQEPGASQEAPSAPETTKPEPSGDDDLLRDPKALLASYKEIQGKQTADAEGRKELESYKAAIETLKADPEFVKWYTENRGDKKDQPAPKIDLADDDLVSVKDMKAIVGQLIQEAIKPERGFIEDMRRKEADRQRDELVAAYPDAKDYAPQMQTLQAQNPNLSLKQLYVLASHDAKRESDVKKTASRQQKAAKFDRPGGVDSAPATDGKSVEEIMGDIWERHHKS